ncbi:MAG TPA: ATP-binding protein [Bacteroidales bacterium]|nr:ATP-binding protein [Bacteroidales bacterium]
MKTSTVSGPLQYLLVIVVIALTGALGRPLATQEGYLVIAFFLLSEVSVMAIFFGIGPILLASTMSSLVWNFFFIPPHFALHIERTEDRIIFVSFFFIALINGVLTNRIRRQEKIARLKEKQALLLAESDKLYKTLFTLISHEFRIPIATIMGASDTLLTSKTSDKDKIALFNEIFLASGRLNHLIENLLSMSRLESGKLSVRTDWCDINDLINKVAVTLSKQLESYMLESNIPADMPLVKLDFGLMEQVIYNLILNAIQHAPEHSVIKFTTGYEHGNLIIIIEDEGPGFSEEQLKRIFTKFYRVDSTRAGGLGLGLSIVKGLVEAHKGNIQVENMPGGGALFRILIPTEIPDIKEITSEQ